MRGRDLVGHPLTHQVDVAAVAPQRVRLVDELLHIAAVARDAHHAVAAHQLPDVLLLPEVGHAERLQHIRPAEEEQPWVVCVVGVEERGSKGGRERGRVGERDRENEGERGRERHMDRDGGREGEMERDR